MTTTQAQLEDVFSNKISNEFDNEISTNFKTQLILTGIGTIAFLIVRKMFLKLYTKNVVGREKHPCYGYNGMFSWIVPIFTSTDHDIINVVGLDGFVLLSTLLLFGRIFFILSIIIGIPLIGIYYNSSGQKNQIFSKISILNIESNNIYIMWVTVFAAYIVTFILLYTLYYQTEKFIAIHMLYRKNPAALTSLTTLKSLDFKFKSEDEMLNYINYSFKTVYLTNLPIYITNKKELKDYVKMLGLGGVEDCSYIESGYRIKNIVIRQQNAVIQFENKVQKTFNKLKKIMYDKREMIQSENPGFNIKLLTKDREVEHRNDPEKNKLSTKEKIEILNAFINNKKFLKSEARGLKNSLKNIQDVIKEINRVRDESVAIVYDENDEIKGDSAEKEKNIKDLIQEKEEYKLGIKPEDLPVIKGENEKKRDQKDIETIDYDFLKPSNIFYRDISKSEYISNSVGFITFKNRKDAEISKQCIITSDINHLKCETTYTPRNIFWENLHRKDYTTQLRSIFINILFALYALFFFSLIASLTFFIEEKCIDKIVEWLLKIEYVQQYTDSIYSFVDSFVKGLVAPTLLNVLISISPILLIILISLNRPSSTIEFDMQLLEMYSKFLLYITVLGSFVGSQLSTLIMQVLQEGEFSISRVLHLFNEKIINVGTLFFNIIVQRAMFGVTLTLLKLGNLMELFIKPYTTRNVKDNRLSTPITFGTLGPTLLLVIPMILIYSVICPVLLLLGCVYFFVLYWLYKGELLYSFHNRTETGGKYWYSFLKFTLINIVIFQLITIAQYMLKNNKLLTLSLVPGVFITYFVGKMIVKKYRLVTTVLPLNEVENEYYGDISKRMLKINFLRYKEWDNSYDSFEKDTISLNELYELDNEKYIYDDAAVCTAYRDIFLPNRFFDTMIYIKNNDNNKTLGYYQ